MGSDPGSVPMTEKRIQGRAGWVHQVVPKPLVVAFATFLFLRIEICGCRWRRSINAPMPKNTNVPATQ